MGVLVTINILFMIFFFVIAYMSIRYFINQIEKYPRVTFEEVYNSKNYWKNLDFQRFQKQNLGGKYGKKIL